MAKGYWITTYRSITDPEKVAAYAQLSGPAVRAAGGTFVVRGVATEVRENGVAERTVVIEFPTYEEAVALYESTAYQQALAVLGDGAQRDIRIMPAAEDVASR